MEQHKRISIVIAVLNGAAELRETLASIERQDDVALDQVELVIIDGGSTDGTLDVVDAATVPVRLTSEPDRGIYDAMNKGAATATGEWLHFLNAGDCLSTTDSLQTALAGTRQADANHRTWFIGGARYAGDQYGGKRIPNLPHAWSRHAMGLQPHCHQATWFRTDLFRALGGYDLESDFVGDFDLILRWGLTGPAQEDDTILIDYLSGGLSERREAEIPALLRRVRRRRMQLDGVPRSVDRFAVFGVHLASKVVRAYARGRNRFGRM